jgi:predicted NBD/HSP70 family sugar kinase
VGHDAYRRGANEVTAEAEGERLGRSGDTMRRYNLSTVLTLAHREGSLSRSRLTRVTGLNRSTIADLIAELARCNLVVESGPSRSNRVGRPSPQVAPDPHVVAFAVNPEIDAITVGVVGLGAKMVARVRRATGSVPSVAEAVEITAAVVAELRAELGESYRIVGIGVAVPGLVRRGDGLVRLAPHLGWVDEPVAELLAAATGYPVVAGNDASLGANAELLFGAGRGVRDLIYLNGGASGIGGGVIVDGTPLRGVEGYAGEFGHTLVTDRDVQDAAGSRGSLETEVNRDNLLAVLGLQHPDPDQLEDALIASRTPQVRGEVRRQLDFLGIALRNAVVIVNPELIVLGGFLGALFAADGEYLTAQVARQTLAPAVASMRMARAKLGSDILMIGAAELAFAPLLMDPAGSIGAS